MYGTKAARLSRKACVVALLATLSCGDAPAEPQPEPATPPPAASVPTTVAVTPASVEFSAIGETVQFTAQVHDQHGAVMGGTRVNWASTARTVVTVTSSGLATAAGSGTAAVTATALTASGSAQVTINQQLASVSLLPEAYRLIAGGSVQVTATPRDANGHAMTGGTFTWTSSDTSVVTVDDAGLVRGRGVGSASVTAISGGAESALDVTVVIPAPVRTVETAAHPTNGGRIDGDGSWEVSGEEVLARTLVANPHPGYDFVRWTEGDVTLSTDSALILQLADEHRLAAEFSVNQERGRWGPGNTHTDWFFPDSSYTSFAWTFLPVVDPPARLHREGFLHYYAFNFRFNNNLSRTAIGYAGFQSDGVLVGERLGKVVNFSIWDADSVRAPNAQVDLENTECRCPQIMLEYEYETGREYRFELGRGPSGETERWKWWGLWVTDVAADSVVFVGELRSPAYDQGRPRTMSPQVHIFGEDLHFWRSRSGQETYVCSDFEPSSLAVLDVTAGADEDRPREVRAYTTDGRTDVADNGWQTRLCHVTVFENENGDVQHNVGFWPEPPKRVIGG